MKCVNMKSEIGVFLLPRIVTSSWKTQIIEHTHVHTAIHRNIAVCTRRGEGAFISLFNCNGIVHTVLLRTSLWFGPHHNAMQALPRLSQSLVVRTPSRGYVPVLSMSKASGVWILRRRWCPVQIIRCSTSLLPECCCSCLFIIATRKSTIGIGARIIHLVNHAINVMDLA